MSIVNFQLSTNPYLSNSVNSDDGEGHDDGYDDEGDLQDFFYHLPALDCCKTLLFEETATIFLVMMVGMMMSIWHKKNLFKGKIFLTKDEKRKTKDFFTKD